MVRSAVTVETTATILEAARRMRDANVGMLPVVRDGVVRGVLTDRDLVVRAMADDVAPSLARVADYVSEPPHCAAEDWTLDDAMEAMALQQVGRLPVVDADGHAIGVVTLSSLALRSPKPRETLKTAKLVAGRSSRAA